MAPKKRSTTKPSRSNVRSAKKVVMPESDHLQYQMRPQRGNPSVFLVVLLIALAFFTGYLFNKVRNLENNAGAAQQAQDAAPTQPTVNYESVPKVTDTDHIRGSKDAKVVLVEYSDLECPFCQKFHPTMQQVLKDYGSDVAWVYRHFPLSFHPKAQKSGEAVECAADQGGNDAFWKMTDAIYEKMPALELSQLSAVATEIGLDGTALQNCLDSNKFAQKVKDEEVKGQAAGVSGTPGTFVLGKNGKNDYINGAEELSSVKAKIDAILK